jgi:hypothetical protein
MSTDPSTHTHEILAEQMRLVEECAGVGALAWHDQTFSAVSYRISRYQAFARSGMPVPGLHRIEGNVDVGAIPEPARLLDRDLSLKLEDGRVLRIALADADGRVLTVGHGPSRCTCC